MNSITLKAPAKVNIFLRILGKRKDGYHDLHTLFERLDLVDTITITKIPRGIEVTSDKFITKDPRDNLVYKAAEAALKAGKSALGVRIRIKKCIPIAGGLGGGSSDAASVLMGVDKLYRLGLTRKRLIGIGAQLGADIPFFILNRPFAIAKGKGEVLKALATKRKLWHVLVNPGFGVATKGVYQAYDRHVSKGLTGKGRDAKIPRHYGNPVLFESFETMMRNDLEPVVTAEKKVIGSIIKRLAFTSGHTTILSGSGPSVFCLCRTRKEAMLARRRFLGSVSGAMARRWQVFVVGTLTA